MILNVTAANFGGPMRNGDLIALCNLVQGLRNQLNEPELQVHVPDDAIQPQEYIRQMRDWLVQNTDYFTIQVGNVEFGDNHMNLWDMRCIYGDVVKITPKARPQVNKIVIVPLFDASYNQYRNWSPKMFEEICEFYSASEYNAYDRIILSQLPIYHKTYKFDICHNFLEGLNHLQNCTIYVGGDTGLSHFVSALDDNKRINYFYGSHGLIHTNPFYTGGTLSYGDEGGFLNMFLGTQYNLKNL